MQVIVDLDGTIALNGHRENFVKQDPPDWDAFFEACDGDSPNEPVIDTMQALYWIDPKENEVIILSGRSDQVREKTVRWLERHVVQYHRLIMRPHGDHTPDDELKARFVDEYGLNPDLVLDDRQKVVDMLRSLGIPCWQVAPGDF